LSKPRSLKKVIPSAVSKTHAGQSASQKRKSLNRARNKELLRAEAKQKGISTESLNHQKYQEALPYNRQSASISPAHSW